MYRLPTQEYTDNADTYFDMWRSLGYTVAEVLTANSVLYIENWGLHGFDPDLQLVSGSRVITLPVDIGLALIMAHSGGLHKLNKDWQDWHEKQYNRTR